MTPSNGKTGRPLVLLCECAGTLKNVDFDRLDVGAGTSVIDVGCGAGRRLWA